jgi:hypothetical protein
VVRVGDTKAAVEAKCGPPASKEISSTVTSGEKDSSQQQSRRSYEEVSQTIETWTYDFGPSRLMQILRFHGDALQSIETGGYGYKE